MFPMHNHNSSYPVDGEDLATALREGLERTFSLRRSSETLVLVGDLDKGLEHLSLTLSGGRIDPAQRPVPAFAQRRQAFRAGRLQVVGQPLHYEDAKIHATLLAEQVHFDYIRDSRGRMYLVPSSARAGSLSCSIAKSDLESLLLKMIREPLGKQGIQVERTDLSLNGSGPRGIKANGAIQVMKRVGFVNLSGKVHVAAELHIDNELNAVVKTLKCSKAEPAPLALLKGFIDEKLQSFEGRSLPLNGLSLGDLRIKDIRTSCRDGLQVEVTLGA